MHVEYTTEELRTYVQLAQSTQPGQTDTSCLGRYFAGGEETNVRKKSHEPRLYQMLDLNHS